jgi:hypothetical protein
MVQGHTPSDAADRWARVGRAVALYTALGTGAVFTGLKLSEAHVREETRLTYGTREKPRFCIGDIGIADEVQPLTVLLAESESGKGAVPLNASVAETVMADFEKTLTIVERELVDLALDAKALEGWRRRFAAAEEGTFLVQLEFNRDFPQYGAMCEAIRSLGNMAELNALNLDMQVVGIEFELGREMEAGGDRERLKNAQPAEAITSIAYAKRVFERVTGHPLPASITIERADISEEGIAGTAESFQQIITVEPMSFSEEVSTLCHEMGHMIARPSEEFEGRLGVFTPIFFELRTREKAVLEEAAAYTFERVCIGAIPDRAIREQATELFESQMLFQARLFFRGETKLHCEAAVVSEAACRVLGGSPAAFNYLSTTGELSPAIRAAIDEVRLEWEGTMVGRCKKAADSLRVLSQRVAALRHRFDPEYSR